MDLLFENVLKFNLLFILIPSSLPLFHLVNEFISKISRNLHIYSYIWLHIIYGYINMETYTCIILSILMFYFLLYLIKVSVNQQQQTQTKPQHFFVVVVFPAMQGKACCKSKLIAGVDISISVFFDFPVI